MKAQEERVIQVFSKDGRALCPCSIYRAEQMVNRSKAIWIGSDMVQLLMTKEDERKEREAALLRDHYTCYITEEKLPPDEITVDHIRSRANGGSDFRENLAACSLKHNRLKGKMDLEGYIRHLIRDPRTPQKLRNRLKERFPHL